MPRAFPLPSLLENTTRSRGKKFGAGHKRPSTFRPGCEVLEDRTLLAVVTWTADADGFWDVPSNWDSGQVPGPADDVIIDRLNADITVTVRSTQSVHSLRSTEVLALTGGSLATAVASQLDAGFTLSGGSLYPNGGVTVGGASFWTSGTLGTGGNGSLTNTGTLSLSGPDSKTLATLLNNSGTITHGGSGGLSGGTLANLTGGVYDLQGDLTLPSAVTNAGTLRKSGGGGGVTVRTFTSLGGQLDVRSGTLAVDGRLGDGDAMMWEGGDFRVAAGATLDLVGADAFQRYELTGDYTGSGGGTVRFQTGFLKFTAAGGTFDFAPGLFQWTGDTVSTIDAGPAGLTNLGTITLSGSGEKRLAGTLTNLGAVLHHGTGNLTSPNPSTLNNRPGGVYDLQGDASIANQTFVNQGTLRKSAGTGASAMAATAFSNDGGIIDVQSGLLRVASTQGVSTGATFRVAEGSELYLTGTGFLDTTHYTGAYAGSGGGTVRVSSGILKVDAGGATFNFPDGMFQWTGGAINGGPDGLTNTGVITLAGPDAKFLGGVLNNAGTIIHAGSGDLQMDYDFGSGRTGAGTLNNLAGGVYDLRGDRTFGHTFGNDAQITNAGTFRKSAGPGTAGVSNILFNNNGGSVEVQAGTFNLGGGTLFFENPNRLRTFPGTTVAIAASLEGDTANGDLFAPDGVVLLNGHAGAGSPQLLEVMSQDLGNVAAGFDRNFSYGTIRLDATYVRLVDNVNNAFGTAAEALYADSLDVPAGSTLDLNGITVYVRASQIQGAVVNGTVAVLPDGGPINRNSFTPGVISTAGQEDEWSFFAYQGQEVTVVGNPGDGSNPSPVEPSLGWMDLRVVAPDGSLVASGSSGSSGQSVTLASVALAQTGTYRVRVRAAAADPGATGNYLLTVWDATAGTQPLVVNQPTTGVLETPFNVGRWTFSAAAGRQVQLDVIRTAAPDIRFTLQGPNGWTGFIGLTGDSGPVTLPADGVYTLEVDSGGTGRGAYAFSLNVPAQALTLGTPYGGTLVGRGDAQFFKVEVTDGNPLLVSFDDSTAADRTEVYVRLGSLPTRQQFDYRTTDVGADHQVVVPFAAPGTWYVLVYGESVAAPSGFTLRVTSTPVTVRGVTPGRQVAGQTVTLTVTGAGFVPGSQVQLVAGPTTVNAQSVAVDAFSRLTATFDLTGVAPGSYDVRVTLPGGASAVLPGAFEVLPAGEPRLETRLILPSALGRHATATLYVEHANSGTVAMPAPILTLQSADPDDSDRPILTLDKSIWVEGFWSSTLPPGFGHSVQIYAGGATPGVLQPGETVRVPVYYAGLLQPWNLDDDRVELEIRIHEAGNTSAIDWPGLQAELKPDWIAADAWPAVYANVQAQIGTTWGDYVQMLSRNAAYLDRLGEKVTDVALLYGFEVQKAIGLDPVGTLASAVDAAAATPGLSLSFGRSFGNTITERGRLGAFGRGWNASWQLFLEQRADGTVIVHESADSQRRFLPDSRHVGTYFSQTGDTGTLKRVTGGAFELTETTGLKTRFRADGKLDYVQDVNGNRITAGFTGGRLTSLTHSAGTSLTIAYNAAGLIASVSDSSGRTTTYMYDATSTHLLSATGPEGTTSYTYATGLGAARENALLSVTGPDGLTRHFDYDPRGRLVATYLDGNALRIDIGYDPAGRVTMTDAAGVASKLFFDHRGLVARSEDAAGNYQLYEYNENLQLIRTTDSLGRSTSFTRCDCGRPKTITDPFGHTILTFTLGGPNNAPTAFTDANGNVTRYAYDAVGNPTRTTYADGTFEQATYDARGNLDVTTNRRGQTIDRTVNAAGQVTHETRSDGTTVDYTYDSRGRLHTATDARGTTTLDYDDADRPTRVEYPNGRWLQYSYDAAGRRTRLEDHTGFVQQYLYDSAGRLERLLDASNNLIVRYTYDAAGRLRREDKGNGTFTVYGYDSLGQTTSIVHHAPDGSVNSQFVYTYDAAGRRTSAATSDGTWTYGYDLTDQLVRAVFDSTNPNIPDQDLNYEYDALGNRVRTIENGTTTGYTANNMNQYTSAGSSTFQYDADGNLIAEFSASGTRHYASDVLNRLTRVETPDGVWQYEYDVLGNRTAVVVNGQRTEYLVDPTGMGDVVGEYNGAGNRVSGYVHGLGLEASTGQSGLGFYDFDALGSTAGVSASAGGYVNRYAYEPFGGELLSTETAANPFEFVGQFGVMHEGNGLDFMGARFYSASEGRFLGKDPLGFGGGQTNFYQYAGNGPVNRIDPTGLAYCGPAEAELQKLLTGLACLITLGATGGAAASGAAAASVATTGGALAGGIGAAGTGTGLLCDPPGTVYSTPTPLTPKTPRCDDDWDPPSPCNPNRPAPICREPPPSPPASFPPPGPPGGSGGGGTSGVGASRDPNEKFGAAGYGTQAFIAADGAIPYRINFENLGPGSVPAPARPATAAAQRVEITDQLSSDLDWASLGFTKFGFGDEVVSIPEGGQYHFSRVSIFEVQRFDVEVELSFDSDTGLMRVVFQTIDPATGLPPDVLTGFLPPEDGTGVGKGFIAYSVQPKAGLATGTQVRNVALIRFDGQPAIATNQIDPHDPGKGTDPAKEALNTIDAGRPTSSVEPLPTFQRGTFTVRWSGTDDAGGSGVAAYDVIVSDNGGPFTAWLTGTTETSATYTGVDGHTYAFYSVAVDHVGNRDVAPGTAQASTRVDTVPPTSSIDPLPATLDTPSFTVSWSGNDGDGSGVATYDIFVSDNGGAFTPLLTGTTLTTTTFTGTRGHSYGFISVATDALGNRQVMPDAAQATTFLKELPPVPVSVTLRRRGSGSKRKLVALVEFSDGGVRSIRSPFQTPAFQRVAASLRDIDGDDVFDTVRFTARKGKKKFVRLVIL